MKKYILLLAFLLSTQLHAQPQLVLAEKENCSTIQTYDATSALVIITANIALTFSTNMDKKVNVVKDNPNGSAHYYELLFPKGTRILTCKALNYPTIDYTLRLKNKETKCLSITEPAPTSTFGYTEYRTTGIQLMTDALFPEALEQFELSKNAPDLPAENDIDKRIKDATDCVASANQLGVLMKAQEWDKAYDACMFLLKHCPSNPHFRNQLNTIKVKQASQSKTNKPKAGTKSKNIDINQFETIHESNKDEKK